MNRKQYRGLAFGTGIAKLQMLDALNIKDVTNGAFGYRLQEKIKHNPRKIANKTDSKRVQRTIMLKEFMNGGK